MAEGHYQPFWIWPRVRRNRRHGASVLGVSWFMKRYFPASRKAYTAGGNALMRVEALFLPSRQHVIEAQEREDEEQGESGDPPETGN